MGEFTHARQMVTVHSVLALAMMSYLLQAVQAPYFGLNKAKMQSLISILGHLRLQLMQHLRYLEWY